MIEPILHALPYVGTLIIALLVGGLFSAALMWGTRRGRISDVDDTEGPTLEVKLGAIDKASPVLNSYLEPCHPEPIRRPRRSVGGYCEFFGDTVSRTQAFAGRVKVSLLLSATNEEFDLWFTPDDADRFAEQIRFSAGRARAQKVDAS